MYVPSAQALTHGGYFVPRAPPPPPPSPSQPPAGTDQQAESAGAVRRADVVQYDTILSAQQMLRSLVQAHGKQLAALPRSDGTVGAGTLLDLANQGLATDTNVRALGGRGQEAPVSAGGAAGQSGGCLGQARSWLARGKSR